MDPNAALENIRTELVNLRDLLDNGYEPYPDNVENLLDTVDDLDEWLSQGGYLPAEWQGRRA